MSTRTGIHFIGGNAPNRDQNTSPRPLWDILLIDKYANGGGCTSTKEITAYQVSDRQQRGGLMAWNTKGAHEDKRLWIHMKNHTKAGVCPTAAGQMQ